MCIGAAGSHLGGDPDRLHDLLSRGALAKRRFRVAADAIGALRHMRDSDCNQLLGLGRQRPISEDLTAKCLESSLGLWSETAALLRERPR